MRRRPRSKAQSVPSRFHFSCGLMANSSSGVIEISSDGNEKTRRNGLVMSCADKEAVRCPVVYIRRPGDETATPTALTRPEFELAFSECLCALHAHYLQQRKIYRKGQAIYDKEKQQGGENEGQPDQPSCFMLTKNRHDRIDVTVHRAPQS
jgi:hypothetical protein